MATEFIDMEMGRGFGLDDSDWGLFIILDEEEKKQTRMKHILQIETIQECEDEYDSEETFGEKSEYYKTDIGIDNDRHIKQDIVKYCYEDNDKDKDYANDKDKDYANDTNEDNETNDIIKFKIKFLITYALTTSFSITLIILTFMI